MNARAVEWTLRISASLIFFGHGLLAMQVHPCWLTFFETVGLTAAFGMRVMPLIGMLDVSLAVAVLIFPARAILMWMTMWALWTALLRPLSGQGVLEFVERGGNFGAPLALLLVRGLPKSVRDLLR